MSADQTDAKAWEALMRLRDLTRMTGTLHDAQVLQLKLWPICIFPHATNQSSFTWNVDLDSDHRPNPKGDSIDVVARRKQPWIAFDVATDPKIPVPADLQFRIQALHKNVQELLGHEWKVSVGFNGRPAFEAEPTVAMPPRHLPPPRSQLAKPPALPVSPRAPTPAPPASPHDFADLIAGTTTFSRPR